MEVDNHITIDLVDIVDVTKYGLTHHMLTENVVVDVLHEGLHHVLVSGLKLLPDGVLFHLNVVIVIYRIAQHISQDFN
jgi:hypothetical protein